MSQLMLDRAGRRQSPATMPGFHTGRAPGNKGPRHPADPPKVEEIVAVTRAAGNRPHGRRMPALIVILWRAGLRINEALELGGQPVSFAATTDGVWIATRGDNRVWRIDPRTGDPLAAIPGGEPPTALAIAAGAVWIGGAAGTLARIDPRAGSLVGSLPLGRPITALAPDAGGVWVSVR